MFDNAFFQKLVDKGNTTGQVIGSDRFLVKVKGLNGIGINSQVVFESGQLGMVKSIHEEYVLVLNLESEDTPLGSFVALNSAQISVNVGDGLIGRVINPLGKPLDGKGSIATKSTWPLFRQAPGIIERELLKDQLFSGVIAVDSLFPIVMGQRIAILGDTKTGKSSFLLQVSNNQKGTNNIVVHVLIGKRQVEIDHLLRNLNETGAINHSIVIIANIFDSLAQTYIAPYVGCAIAEFLWNNGRDVIIIYDDISSHAKVYREIGLLCGDNPGRESYPGDMFFAHSTLLERAGKLASNSKTLTALPVVVTPNDDITALLPTNIMSITDGQIIFDLETFKQNVKPAINSGLSVSRVGGRAQNERQKLLSAALFKRLAEYRQAYEFAHFGSELTPEVKQSLQLGSLIQEALRQPISELYSSLEQQLVMQTILMSAGLLKLNVGLLKLQARQAAPNVKTDADFEPICKQLLGQSTMETNV
ncbi:MAG TPA: sodium-transporting two-sector ATPase [Candidatus Saccharimonadales bacterium]|nr:sodium-transporting two-sector ATPase [Candidatus Saccharimonadales bacterium]